MRRSTAKAAAGAGTAAAAPKDAPTTESEADKKEKKAPRKDKAKLGIPCVMAMLAAALYQAYPEQCDEAAGSLGRAILSVVLPPPEAGEGVAILITFLISRVMFMCAAGMVGFVLYLLIWVLILTYRR
jgi:hypothetical protein